MKRNGLRRVAAVIVLSMLCGSTAPVALAEDKKETVYVFADAEGNVNDITVSERLYNYEGKDEIVDVTRLENIENIGGDQTYSTVTDGVITWKAGGDEITYEGTSDAPLPVAVHFEYKLDGQPIKPEDLAGKSGHLRIDVSYESLLEDEVVVNGRREKMPVPFLMVSVVKMDEEKFSNVTVTNGKYVTAGNLRGAVCYGLPGIAEALHLSDYDEVDIDVPTHCTIEADVVDYASDGSYTFATSYVADIVDKEDKIDLDTDALGADLRDAMDQLEDGATALADGTGALRDGTEALAEGADRLADGAVDLLDGAKQLNDGANNLEDGARQLSEGAGDLSDGAQALDDGAGRPAGRRSAVFRRHRHPGPGPGRDRRKQRYSGGRRKAGV